MSRRTPRRDAGSRRARSTSTAASRGLALFAYVGSASNDPSSSGISWFHVDEGTGALTPSGRVAQARPVFLTVAPGKRRLYSGAHAPSVDGVAGAAVYAYAIADDGTLTVLNHQMLPLTHVAYVRTDRQERFLL